MLTLSLHCCEAHANFINSLLQVLTLSPGLTLTLLPCAEAPPPLSRADVELEFTLRLPQAPFAWASLPPGRRPDTLVVRGLPYAFFGLTPGQTLARHHVASGASWLRRCFASFGAVWDLDVRAPGSSARDDQARDANRKAASAGALSLLLLLERLQDARLSKSC